MHPAVSVIFFTVSSGAGFGLMGVLGLGIVQPSSILALAIAYVVACAFAVAGLLSSTLHLGHPERAWRAMSQWKSSWLSREGISAIVTLLLFTIFAADIYWTGTHSAYLGAAVLIGSIVTVFTTAMIYAQLKTVPHWHSFWTPTCYLLFSAASGLLLAQLLANSHFSKQLAWASLAMIILAWAAKAAWWQNAKTASLAGAGHTPESATGLGAIGKVSLLERPHTGENYLTREMVHVIGRKHSAILRKIALFAGAVLPFALMIVAVLLGTHTLLSVAAFAFLLGGLFIERWLFFAEATHAVSLYYGHR